MIAPALQLRACTWAHWRAKTWADVSELGRVAHDKYRGWHIDFRAVEWPEAEAPRRVRFNKTQQGGRFLDEAQAHQCLTLIRERAMGRPLYEILSEYMSQAPAEQCVPARWRDDFIAAKKVARLRGEISKDRLDALASYPRRGYLAFWDECPVGKIDGPAVAQWHEWLRATFPHLGPVSMKHILSNFRTFCGHLRRVGALPIVPEFPRVRVPKRRRVVPDHESLAKVLGAIPEASRGLWLARAYAGLRPAEARRVNVSDYRDGLLTIRAEICKTGEERQLPIAHVVPELAAWIEAHRKGAKRWEPLFPAPKARDGRWKATPERRVWIAALQAAEVEHVKPNMGGRHAFATHEVARKTDALALRDWMGHASLQTTLTYVHADAVSLAHRMRPVAQFGTKAQDRKGKSAKSKEKK